MIERYDSGLEARLSHRLQPVLAREQPFDVAIVHGANGAVALAQQVRVVDRVRRVGRIGIPAPLQVAQRAAVAVVIRRVRLTARTSRERSRARRARRRPDGSARTRFRLPLADRPRWSCTRSRRARRPRRTARHSRTVRMSPWTCSHSGLSARLLASMPGDGSTSVIAKCALRMRGVVAAAASRVRAPFPAAGRMRRSASRP